MKKIILIGAGGHAKSCIDVILLTKKYKILGFIDQKKKINIFNYKVLGDESYLKKFKQKNCYLHLSLGFIKSPEKRIKIFNEFRKLNFKFPKIISPKAYVSKNAKISPNISFLTQKLAKKHFLGKFEIFHTSV